ncbi:MAG: esterase [Gracilibacter sp. BRH_c7a]|nr:MAG: esterase [Gracilibacter sp. BRH_c7a]
MYIKEELVSPFFFPGEQTGILLIHGFTAAPIDMKPLGERFRDWGYTVSAPLLPGHGRTPEEMRDTVWDDWIEEADKALTVMRETCQRIIAVGHSMGGLMVLDLATQHKIDGVVSVNAPIVYRDPELHEAYYLLGKQEYVYKPHKDSEISVTKEGLPHFSYLKVPVKCFVSLNQTITRVKNELSKIKCPALIIQCLEDQTIHPSSGGIIGNSIAHPRKEVLYWENENHYLPLSPARNDLAYKIKQFIVKYDLD